MIASKDSEAQVKNARQAKASVPACAICGNPRSEEYRPFCSKRCADVDLGRWLNGSYAVPVETDADEDGENPAESIIPAPNEDGGDR
jgi:endogenous inhibitor of DNA gyrase (YacG/DUF329 family)